MVQNGKFSAAAWLFVRTLKNVDFPTLGIPTIPTFRLVPTRPISGFLSGSSIFFGAILRQKHITDLFSVRSVRPVKFLSTSNGSNPLVDTRVPFLPSYTKFTIASLSAIK